MKCSHKGDPVQIGEHVIYAAGAVSLEEEDLAQYDHIVSLLGHGPPFLRGVMKKTVVFKWPDFQPPPPGFENFLRETVIPALRDRKRILVFCMGGHGRTGTFLAGLLALMEPEVADPVAEVRKRYCLRAVETKEQEAAIAAMKG